MLDLLMHPPLLLLLALLIGLYLTLWVLLTSPFLVLVQVHHLDQLNRLLLLKDLLMVLLMVVLDRYWTTLTARAVGLTSRFTRSVTGTSS